MTGWERWASPHLPSLGFGLDDLILTGIGDAAPGHGFRPLEPAVARLHLKEWLSSSGHRERLAATWSVQMERRIGLSPRAGPNELDLMRIEQALAEQKLVLWLRDRAGGVDQGLGPSIETPSIQTGTKTTWIEVVLVAEGGAPLGGERYRITTPDGSLQTGRLGADGAARLDGLVAGVCDITFPDLDGREWGRSSPPSPPDGADAISHVHTVRQGEDATSIAALYGFRHWKTVWAHPANTSLRAEREPDMLFPGDEVSVPARTERVEEGGTAARHRFFALVASRKLHVILLGLDQKPLANAQYTLWLGDVAIAEDSTDASGALQRAIPLDAREVTLECALGAFTLEVGALNPLDDVADKGVSGAQGRLNNLGYDAGPIDGRLGSRTQEALRRFQVDQGIEASGFLDGATKAKLRSAHGS